MLPPIGLALNPLTDFGEQSYKTLFEDDFAVKKYVLKTKLTTPNNGIFNLKQTYVHKLNKEFSL